MAAGGEAAAACEDDHSPPSSADVKNAWSYNYIPPTSSWRGAYQAPPRLYTSLKYIFTALL
jgi:hypothetical protein